MTEVNTTNAENKPSVLIIGGLGMTSYSTPQCCHTDNSQASLDETLQSTSTTTSLPPPSALLTNSFRSWHSSRLNSQRHAAKRTSCKQMLLESNHSRGSSICRTERVETSKSSTLCSIAAERHDTRRKMRCTSSGVYS